MRDIEQNPYLEQEVLTASPARLRWLLLQKSVSLCKVVHGLWTEGQFDLAAQWQIRVRDILNELLGGVKGQDLLAKQVTDLYIYMITLLTQAELHRDREPLEDLMSLLEIELETWTLVQHQLAGTQRPHLTYSATAMPRLDLTELSGNDSSSICFDA